MSLLPSFRYGCAHVPRHLSWWVLLGVPALLLATLVLMMREPPPVRAAAPHTYVNCQGASPHYSTIQDAVNDTEPGGVVHICSGTYSESVNLGLMNEGNGAGDITLIAEDGPGTVLIQPASDAGIFIDNDNFSTFAGNIVIKGIHVRAVEYVGIDLSFPDDVSGTVSIEDVVVRDALYDGIVVGATGDITIRNTQAISNGTDGIVLYYSADTANPPFPTFTLDTVIAERNGRTGITLEGPGSIFITTTQVNDNGDYGLDSGLFIRETHTPAVCPDPLPQVRLNNLIANNNRGLGVFIYNTARDTFIEDSQTISNAFDGVAIGFQPGGQGCYGGDVTVTGSRSDDNGWAFQLEGVDLEDYSTAGFRISYPGLITLQSSSAARNTSAGFCLIGESYSLGGLEATDNGSHGITITFDCMLEVPEGEEQAEIDASSIRSASVISPSIQISNTTVSNNGAHGIELVYFFTEPPIERGSVNVMEESTPDTQPVTITNVSAISNADHGILITLLEDSFFMDGATIAQAEPPMLEYPPVVISSSLVMSNGGYGVRFESHSTEAAPAVIHSQPSTPNSFVNGSIICENIQGGVGISDTLTFYEPQYVQSGDFQAAYSGTVPLYLDATGNWWGAATGPAHPTNQDGTGDPVMDGANGGSGEVVFSPWISRIRASAVPSPTLAGLPTNFTFQFSDDGTPPSVFLGPGVGNLNDPPPFRLLTTNGTLTGATGSGATVGQYISGDEGKLQATLTPAASGMAEVQLVGPCGLAQTLQVPVMRPDVTIEKSPEMQVAPAGAPVSFAIHITNTGDITLTELVVSDALAPGCTRTLAELGPGVPFSYPCTLTATVDLTNTAIVSGRALLEGRAQGDVVSAEASARVDVKALALSLRKTAWIEGYGPACPEEREIPPKVPIGTVMKYCYTVTNIGEYTVTSHSLVDDKLGVLFSNLQHDLPPGASYSSVEAGVTITALLTVSTTNVATWTSSLVFPPVGVADVDEAQALVSISVRDEATVNISGPDDDQDGDGIPDNEEGAGDDDNDGIPNFLDPETPTSLDEVDQPAPRKRLYLPSLPD